MRNFNIKTDITWRDVALRVALVLGTVAIIVWFMPRDNKPNFKVEVDKVWLYNDLTATFDFPVYKSDSIVQREREEAMRDFEPYYVYDNTVADKQLRALAEHVKNEMPELGNSFLRTVITPIRTIYRQGIVDTKEPLGNEADTMRLLRRIDDKEAVSVLASQVYTPRQAYEELLKSPQLASYQNALQQVSLNNYLVPNLTRHASTCSTACRWPAAWCRAGRRLWHRAR